MSNDDLLRMLDLEGKEAPLTNESLPYSGPRKLDHRLSYCCGPGKG